MRVVGVGNPLRGDDAAGVEVARRLRLEGVPALEREGEPTALLDVFGSADALVLVDAVRSGAPAGTVHRLDAAAGPVPSSLYRSSTHHFSLAETIELARALGRLPARTIVYGIEAASFETGAPLTPEVERAVDEVVSLILKEL